MAEAPREVVLPASDADIDHLVADLRSISVVVNGQHAEQLSSTLQLSGLTHFRIQALVAIAGGLHEHGEFGATDQLFERAVRTAEELLGPTDPAVSAVLRERAGFLMEVGRATEAVDLYRQALTVLRSTLDPDHPDIVTMLHDLALTCEMVGRIDEAQLLWAEARAAFSGGGSSCLHAGTDRSTPQEQ
ncbi:MAG: tetratricopeptide repeat protein [Actinobacteria bacterium]|nr:tetratricopeptide repeat protein [Actinomycetota bacterium]